LAVVFTFSSFVIGPALTGADNESASKPNAAPSEAQPAKPGEPAQPTPDEHESHHP
jgi:hypothetical protein